MKKKMISIWVALMLILMIFQQTSFQAYAAETESDAQTIAALNALLIGVNYPSGNQQGNTSAWSNAAISDVIYGKLLWEMFNGGESSSLSGLGLAYTTDQSGDYHYNLDLIQRITQDTLGRNFPDDTQLDYIYVSENQVIIMPALGESTSLIVERIFRNGSQIVAEGRADHSYNAYDVGLGDFCAIFVENQSSVYGYTLVSISKSGNGQQENAAQNNYKDTYGNVKASASSELREPWAFHGAGNVLDGDLNTAWSESAEGYGINEWICLESVDGSKLDVAAIEFAMGFQENEDLLRKNGWPNKVMIECEGGYRQEVVLDDYSSIVVLKQPVNAGWIKFTILDVVEGAKYEDTCISEISLIGFADAETAGLVQEPIDTYITISSDSEELSVCSGDIITLKAWRYVNGEVNDDASGVFFEVKDPSILEVNSFGTENGYLYVELKGIAVGTASVIFVDELSEEQTEILIAVYADSNKNFVCAGIAAVVVVGLIFVVVGKRKK